MKSNHGRVNVSINGALSWPNRTVVHRQAEKITSAELIKLIDNLQQLHPSATAISVVLDNARYNHSGELNGYLSADGCRIGLVYLPSYAHASGFPGEFGGRTRTRTLDPLIKSEIFQLIPTAHRIP